VLDNLRRRLDSGALAAVLTSGIWQDRLLGVSRTVTLYVECIWIGTANNPQFSKEMSRRVVSCRMDAKMERPWDRPPAGFRHPDLLGWIGAHRGELIWASLVLVQNWLALGRPAGSAQLGSFESWAQTLGGILDAAGIPGLLSNAADFYTRADDESRPWRSFLAGWWREYQSTPCLSKDLLTLALDTLEIDAKSEGAQKIRLGKMLKSKVGTRFTIGDGLIVAVCRDEDLHDKVMRWSLQKVDDSPHSPQDSPPYKHKENNASRVVQVVAGSVSLMREGGGVDSGDTESEAMRAPENLSGRIVTRNSPQLLALPATGEPSATPKRTITEADWQRGTRIIDPDDPANDLEPSEEELAEAEARARQAGRRP